MIAARRATSLRVTPHPVVRLCSIAHVSFRVAEFEGEVDDGAKVVARHPPGQRIYTLILGGYATGPDAETRRRRGDTVFHSGRTAHAAVRRVRRCRAGSR